MKLENVKMVRIAGQWRTYEVMRRDGSGTIGYLKGGASHPNGYGWAYVGAWNVETFGAAQMPNGGGYGTRRAALAALVDAFGQHVEARRVRGVR